MSSNMNSNLEVTIHLETPVLLGHPYIHFDGIITHLLLREKMGNDYYTSLPSKMPLAVYDHALNPVLKSSKIGGVLIYHASVSIFDSDIMAATTIYKKFDTHHADRLRSTKTLYSDRGLYKSYMMKMLYNPSRKCRFYAKGNYDYIGYLLSFLPGLGKKVDVGFGAISRIDVQKTDRDRSIMDGIRVMRPIPVELLDDYTEAYPSVFIPPYWNRANTRMCAPAFAEAVPKRELAAHLA